MTPLPLTLASLFRFLAMAFLDQKTWALLTVRCLSANLAGKLLEGEMKSIVVVLALASCFVAQPAWAGLDENIGAELKRLCSAGKSITAVTDGHCCWANQEWSIKLGALRVGRPFVPLWLCQV